MKRNERKPAAREEKEELPLGLVVAAWLAGAWTLALGGVFFTLWLLANAER